MMIDEVDCFQYEDKWYCEDCGLAIREDIHDSSGRPSILWEHASQCFYPQRAVGDAKGHCSECDVSLGDL
jgi:hypothetical protein